MVSLRTNPEPNYRSNFSRLLAGGNVKRFREKFNWLMMQINKIRL
jgi:hypothetical protein